MDKGSSWEARLYGFERQVEQLLWPKESCLEKGHQSHCKLGFDAGFSFPQLEARKRGYQEGVAFSCWFFHWLTLPGNHDSSWRIPWSSFCQDLEQIGAENGCPVCMSCFLHQTDWFSPFVKNTDFQVLPGLEPRSTFPSCDSEETVSRLLHFENPPSQLPSVSKFAWHVPCNVSILSSFQVW